MSGLDGADRALLVGLALTGVLCAIGGVGYLTLLVGTVPMPISAVLFPVLLAGSAVAARRIGGAGAAAAPVLVFFATVALMLSGLPGGNVFPQDWRLLLLAGCGIAAPAAAVWWVNNRAGTVESRER